MLGDITVAKDIYIACGYTDMRKSIDGLAALVQQQFRMDPFSPALFLFWESYNYQFHQSYYKIAGIYAN